MNQNAQIQLTQPSPIERKVPGSSARGSVLRGNAEVRPLLIQTVGRAGVHDPPADIGMIVPAPVYIHIDSVILLTKPFSHVIIISKHG